MKLDQQQILDAQHGFRTCSYQHSLVYLSDVRKPEIRVIDQTAGAENTAALYPSLADIRVRLLSHLLGHLDMISLLMRIDHSSGHITTSHLGDAMRNIYRAKDLSHTGFCALIVQAAIKRAGRADSSDSVVKPRITDSKIEIRELEIGYWISWSFGKSRDTVVLEG